MKLILGKKEYMTQMFDQTGRVRPATVLSVPANKVAGLRGAQVVQLGFGEKKLSRLNKAQQTMVNREGFGFEAIMDWKAGEHSYQVGDQIEASIFTPGEKVAVSSISKGKGFQGVVKRHGFKGGRRSHGQKHSEREAGSIGATGPQRVFKGLRMAGRMGSDRVTVKNLEVLAVDQAKQLMVVSGAIPGRRGTLVEIKN